MENSSLTWWLLGWGLRSLFLHFWIQSCRMMMSKQGSVLRRPAWVSMISRPLYTMSFQLGCRYIVVAGLPPVGCLPIQETISFQNPLNRYCIEDQNSDSTAYNQKLSKLLGNLQPQLPGSKILYADIYTPLIDMVNNPSKYGFEHTNRGCCGTGLLEAGPLCNPITPTCEDPSKFMFWDSIHPTEAAYQFIAESMLEKL